MSEVDPRWYEGFFGQDWLALAGDFDEARDLAEVDFLVEKLQLDPGARVLDMACGRGRHAVELAARGFRVTGIDISEPSIAIAQERASERAVELELLQQDIRDLTVEAEFDALFSFGGSFGFFPAEDEDLRLIERAARALRPGGRLLIEAINDLWLARHFQPHGWRTLMTGRS